MKQLKKILFVLLLSFMVSSAYSQQSGQLFKSLDRKELMSKLLKSTTFNSRQEAVWKPGAGENVHLPVSYNRFCYALLDTLFRFKGKDPVHGTKVDRVAVVFITSEYGKYGLNDCHACSPAVGVATFTKTASAMWKLHRFKK